MCIDFIGKKNITHYYVWPLYSKSMYLMFRITELHFQLFKYFVKGEVHVNDTQFGYVLE